MKRELIAFFVSALVGAMVSLSSVEYSAPVKEAKTETTKQSESEQEEEKPEFDPEQYRSQLGESEDLKETEEETDETESDETEAEETEPEETEAEETDPAESEEDPPAAPEPVEPQQETPAPQAAAPAPAATPPVVNTDSGSNSSASSEPEKKSIPSQTESTASISSSRINKAKSIVKSYVTGIRSLSYSSDLENAAILRAQGQGQNGMDILATYGGEGWKSKAWAEVRGSTYFVNDTDEAVTAAAEAVCSSLAAGTIGNSSYKEYGVGIHVTGQQGMYTLQVAVLLTN